MTGVSIRYAKGWRFKMHEAKIPSITSTVSHHQQDDQATGVLSRVYIRWSPSQRMVDQVSFANGRTEKV